MKPNVSSSIAILLACTVADAAASPSCMTKAEARAAFPRAHLYWSGEKRCWSDRRGRMSARRQYRAPVSDEMPKPPPPEIMVPEPEPKQLRTTETTTIIDKTTEAATNEQRRRLDEQRAALEVFATKLVPPPQIYTGLIPEPAPEPEPESMNRWARWAVALMVFTVMSVGGGLMSKRYLPKLMVGS